MAVAAHALRSMASFTAALSAGRAACKRASPDDANEDREACRRSTLCTIACRDLRGAGGACIDGSVGGAGSLEKNSNLPPKYTCLKLCRQRGMLLCSHHLLVQPLCIVPHKHS